MWQLADNQINGGLVIGAAKLDWHGLDPEAQPVILSVDGDVVAAGEGDNSAATRSDCSSGWRTMSGTTAVA